MEMHWVEETAIWESSWQLMLMMEFNCRGDAYLVFIYISRELTTQQCRPNPDWAQRRLPILKVTTRMH